MTFPDDNGYSNGAMGNHRGAQGPTIKEAYNEGEVFVRNV